MNLQCHVRSQGAVGMALCRREESTWDDHVTGAAKTHHVTDRILGILLLLLSTDEQLLSRPTHKQKPQRCSCINTFKFIFVLSLGHLACRRVSRFMSQF